MFTISFCNKMSLFKLKSAPLVVIEDDNHINILPLVLELIYQEKSIINLFCYEQPVSSWKKVLNEPNIEYYQEYQPENFKNYTSSKCCIVVDSINQMALCLGWSVCLRNLKSLQENPNVARIILVLHKDCLSHYSKLQLQLNHIASGIVSYDSKNPYKVKIQLKRGGKFSKTEEMLVFDEKIRTLKSKPIFKEENKESEPEKPLPASLTTFKIEMDQIDKMEKYKLKLPYMTRNNESKVFYEPDAVDDWDEEDPDEDLDI